MSSTAAALPSPEAAALETLERYARELHEFLESMPAQLSGSGRLDELSQGARRLLETAPRSLDDPRLEAIWARAQARLAELQAALATSRSRAALLALHEDLSRTYEQWIEQLREVRERYGVKGAAALDSVKPLIAARTLFHVLMGIVAAVTYQFLLGAQGCMVILGTLFTIFAGLEISRRVWPRWNELLLSSRLLHPIARPREYHHVNSSTWYLLGLCILVPLVSKTSVITAVLVLGFADPAAAWIGKRFGTKKLYRNKSLAGALAFFAVAFAVAWPYLAVYGTSTGGLGLSAARALLVAVAAAFAGTLAELFSGRLDDNLTVPLGTALTVALLLP